MTPSADPPFRSSTARLGGEETVVASLDPEGPRRDPSEQEGAVPPAGRSGLGLPGRRAGSASRVEGEDFGARDRRSRRTLDDHSAHARPTVKADIETPRHLSLGHRHVRERLGHEPGGNEPQRVRRGLQAEPLEGSLFRLEDAVPVVQPVGVRSRSRGRGAHDLDGELAHGLARRHVPNGAGDSRRSRQNELEPFLLRIEPRDEGRSGVLAGRLEPDRSVVETRDPEGPVLSTLRA